MIEIHGFIPLFERVLIKPDEPEKLTETGIILPASSIKRPNTGIVMAIGHLVGQSKAPINIGDHVLYLRYSGFDTVINGETYHLVMVNDLVGIIDNSGSNTFELKDYS
jgi:chaperonin GroES